MFVTLTGTVDDVRPMTPEGKAPFIQVFLNQPNEQQKVKLKIYSKMELKVGETRAFSGRVYAGEINGHKWEFVSVQ